MPILSKSSFVRGMQCHKSLYLHFFQPALKDPISVSQQHIFDIGHNTGFLAQQLFPGGIDASRGNPQEVKQAVAYTQHLIASGQQVIYEAAFSDGYTRCYMDILALIDGRWEAFEVKASTSAKDYHYQDIAFQYHAIRQAGLDLAEISLVHLNNKYIRRGEIDINQLFTKVRLTDKARAMQPDVISNLAAMQTMLNQPQPADIPIGAYCTNPFPCDFYGHCHINEVDDMYAGMKGIKKVKIEKLREIGVSSLEEIPPSFAFTSKEWVVLKGLLNDEISHNKEALKRFVDHLQYPLYFLDFETFMPPIPLYNESRPYQQIPFQYSLHIQETPESKPVHLEYLGTPPEDPRPLFIKNMIDQLGNSGNIIVYNKAFEQSRIRELARDFPAFADDLLPLNERIVDLMMPFQRQYLYTPDMKGSYSIKAVLPALVNNISYDDLDIQEGGTASLTYQSLYTDNDPVSIATKRKNLIEYCTLDTLAMVKLLHHISKP
jgi:hypothetical protein